MANSVSDWVWFHSRARHGTRLVLLALAWRARDDGVAWPSVADIKRMTGLGERAVQTAIAEAEKLGELEVIYQQGPKGCNRYRLLMPQTPAESAPPPQNLRPPRRICAPAESAPPPADRQVNGQTPAESAPPPQNLRPAESAPPPAESAPGKVITTSTNSPTESSHIGGPGEPLFDIGEAPARAGRPRRQRGTPKPEPPGFAEWYAAYPAHKARGEAVEAYRKAIDAGADPAALLAGAVAYCGDEHVLRGFIKNPATWLNKQCWLDEPTPPPRESASGHAQPRKVNYSDEEYARGWGQSAR